ncbi:MAG TPA: endonuclease III [Planctomycetota bacterium]|jgi:endonuclease-3|nr:endonuclease III [Planctomycetota bacterium]OQC21471.1 MAG: Endonuclease III [Planctomycetes bacterium ADurb.Bin069]HNR97770.1 endonuclease III [Planctomycetota bacterium]HNU24763.1 endonuclease III [Planctomycetota bacterium]HOE30939.1 endonuclease III [Planctomycetota bacterium]
MPPRPSPLSRSSFPISKALAILRRAARAWKLPMVTELSAALRDPFAVLISTMLSLRTKDATTAAASDRLFALAATPRAMQALDAGAVARAIFPVGFYRTKAAHILATCRILVDRFGGEVPSDLDALLELPGVGRKTANLVLTRGFGLPGICVDTHVHRISNRWGYIRTRTPAHSETALRKRLPPRHWIEYNDLLVAFGQNCCTPLSPRCSICPLAGLCPRRGVKRSR